MPETKPLADQKILACPHCGQPNGFCHGKPVVMTKMQAANLAVNYSLAEFIKDHAEEPCLRPKG